MTSCYYLNVHYAHFQIEKKYSTRDFKNTHNLSSKIFKTKIYIYIFTQCAREETDEQYVQRSTLG